jgi:2-keto-4-pentenoate hydratase
VHDDRGGHPAGDPFGFVVSLVNAMRCGGGVGAGQIVTTGSWTGLRFLRPGDRCALHFKGLGDVEVAFDD